EQPHVPRKGVADDRPGHERRDVRRMFWPEHDAETRRNQVLQMPEPTAPVSNLRLDARREELAPQVAPTLAPGAFEPDGLLQDVRWHGRQLGVSGLLPHEHEEALREEPPVIDP